MRTLRTSVDALEVKSFLVEVARHANGGTVHARATGPLTPLTSTGEASA